MHDVQLNGHIIVEYPQLGKYTVLFREGGIQNFCQKFDDLPDKLQKIIEDCKARGATQSHIFGAGAKVTKDAQPDLNVGGLEVHVYSDLF